MTAENAVMRNVLIDMASVEGTILLKTDQHARRIMDGTCPDRCIRAFTATGGMAMGRNRRGGEGRYQVFDRYMISAIKRDLVLNYEELRNCFLSDDQVFAHLWVYLKLCNKYV
ncbi:hypothetical protein GCK32_003579 [Trichostrongylus colubriformis]|uniref:Uncharacterized protein n=1 Tax=Trichostrongylus colubriformis TaxID=6319 RepID=A0AAN8FK89_TRICO